MIISPHNTTLKLVRQLIRDPKERKASGLFVVEGFRLMRDLLDSSTEIDTILISSEPSKKSQKLIDTLDLDRYEVQEVEATIFEKISATENSQGILAICHIPIAKVSELPELVLLPDMIRDPGNLGTLLRSAVAAGVGLVLIPPETTDPYSPKTLRSGMGAHFYVPILRASWERIEGLVGEHQVLIASADGDRSIWEAPLREKTVVIIGGEADGASEYAEKLANLRVRIPMEGKIESLNAGIAGSLILFEALRQRSNVK